MVVHTHYSPDFGNVMGWATQDSFNGL